MKRLLFAAALLVAVTVGTVGAQENSVEPEHFPQWMVDESYLLGATAPVSVKKVVCGPVYRNAGTVVTIETLGWYSRRTGRDRLWWVAPKWRMALRVFY